MGKNSKNKTQKQDQNQAKNKDQAENIDRKAVEIKTGESNEKKLNQNADVLSELEIKLAQETEAKLMAIANLDNYRKQVAKEKDQIRRQAVNGVLISLADLIDDFDRMVSDLEDPNSEDQIDAFKPVLDKAKGILADHGLSQIEIVQGDKFSPESMHAIGTVVVEPDKQNSVMHIAQKGYKYQDGSILRHARVIVGKAEQ